MHGVYIDDVANIHPTVLEQYYGIEGPILKCEPGQTGAGLSGAYAQPTRSL
jgi:hypothetical protein